MEGIPKNNFRIKQSVSCGNKNNSAFALQKHQFSYYLPVLIMFLVIPLFVPTVFADEPTGNEPPTNAYIEAQQSPDGSHVDYTLIHLDNIDWKANAQVIWKSHLFCGTFTGTTFTYAGCGNLKTVDQANNLERICVFLVHKNGEILMGSYPERGYKHGYGDALHKPTAEELTCYGSTQAGALGVINKEKTPATEPVVEQQQEEQVPANEATGGTNKQGGGVPWVPIALGIAIIGAGVLIVKKHFGDGLKFEDFFLPKNWSKSSNSLQSQEKEEKKKLSCEEEKAALERAVEAIRETRKIFDDAFSEKYGFDGIKKLQKADMEDIKKKDLKHTAHNAFLSRYPVLKRMSDDEFKAQEEYKRAKKAYEACTNTANEEAEEERLIAESKKVKRTFDQAPADYKRPDNSADDENEVM